MSFAAPRGAYSSRPAVGTLRDRHIPHQPVPPRSPLLVCCGAWTVVRRPSNPVQAARAAILASWVGDVAAPLIVFAPRLAGSAGWTQFPNFTTTRPGLTPLDYLKELLIFTTALAAICGAAGGLVGKFVLGIQEGLQ